MKKVSEKRKNDGGRFDDTYTIVLQKEFSLFTTFLRGTLHEQYICFHFFNQPESF